jgi:dipeptidase E
LSNPTPKLILHSDQSVDSTGARDAELLRSLSGKKNPKIVYLGSTSNARRKVFDDCKKYYEKIGLPDVQLFEPEQANSDEKSIAFKNTDVVHLSGGEVIPFADRLRATGCDHLLKDFVQRGGVVVGVSAGAMILGRTFKTSAIFKENGFFIGLGLYDFEIIPHASEMFPRNDAVKIFAEKNNVNIYTLNDGDILVIHGKKIKTLGNIDYFVGSPTKT